MERQPPDGKSPSALVSPSGDLTDMIKSDKFKDLVDKHPCSENKEKLNELRRRLIHEASVDSSCSDLSLDFFSKNDLGLSTVDMLAKLQEEVENIKHSFEGLDEDVNTLISDRLGGDSRRYMRTTYSNYSLGTLSSLSRPESVQNDEQSDTVNSESPNKLNWDPSETRDHCQAYFTPKGRFSKREWTPDSPCSRASSITPHDASYASLEWDPEGVSPYPEDGMDMVPGCLSTNILLPDHLKSLEMNMESELTNQMSFMDLNSGNETPLPQDESALISRSSSDSSVSLR